jgi:formylglycine-generating enzyme required for sulfatase activity
MQRFLEVLKQAGLELDADAIADALWLATHMALGDTIAAAPEPPASAALGQQQPEPEVATGLPELPAVPAAQISLPPAAPSSASSAAAGSGGGVPFQAPAAPALRKSLELGRSLRPLMRKVPSRCLQVLDEEATALQIAESRGQRQWIPVFQPAQERWLNLALVVEQTRSTVIWQELIAEFQTLLERQGAFRTIRAWSLRSSNSLPAPGSLELLPQQGGASPMQSGHARSARELLDPTGQQLVLVISDCVSLAWQTGKIHLLLQQWAEAGPTAIVQLLPERLWHRSTLGLGLPAQLRALLPGVASPQLQVAELPVWERVNLDTALTLPVVTLEPESLAQWAQVVAGVGPAQTAGVVFERDILEREPEPEPEPEALTPEELVQQFRVTASPLARRLAGLMSIVPVSLPVIHLIQEAVLSASRQVHVAEIFMSGLVQAVPPAKLPRGMEAAEAEAWQAEAWQYEFVPEVRRLLQSSVPKTETLMVLDRVSQYVAERAGLSIKSFAALLTLNLAGETGSLELRRFAELVPEVLRRLGSDWAALVDEMQGGVAFQTEPALKTLEFESVTIVVEEEAPTVAGAELQPFEFETVTVDRFGQETQRETRTVFYFMELLGTEQLPLELVAIPGGEFLMGSPEDEPERYGDEGPQHQVTVSPFFLGKYPVTQAQWRAVATTPKVSQELDPDLSGFKGENRPVETVSWDDATEFCARLRRDTGREYRLPTEAEWEYACRAGTTTPFSFGETLIPDLANYNGNYTYQDGPKGEYREQTTEVGTFPANEFGLCDLHGNVWEWCLDHWHGNYEGAPIDGSAWLTEDDNVLVTENGEPITTEDGESILTENAENGEPILTENDSLRDASELVDRVVRGGSWFLNPRLCRSASRDLSSPDYRSYTFGFRVVCGGPRTL